MISEQLQREIRFRIGRELRHDPGLSRLDRLYTALIGSPPTGLGIRTRRIFQALTVRLPAMGNPVRRVLDLGCGRGVTCYALARGLPQAEIMGLDIDEDRLARNRAIAEAEGLGNCRFQSGMIRDLVAQNEMFDVIISADCIEHVEDDAGFLSDVRRCLRPGGLLLLHTPSLHRHPLWGRSRVNFDIEGHVRYGYTREDLDTKVEKAGFAILERRATFGVLETLANEWEYAITSARGRNKAVFGLVFPMLALMCWIGRNAHPEAGSAWRISATIRP